MNNSLKIIKNWIEMQEKTEHEIRASMEEFLAKEREKSEILRNYVKGFEEQLITENELAGLLAEFLAKELINNINSLDINSLLGENND